MARVGGTQSIGLYWNKKCQIQCLTTYKMATKWQKSGRAPIWQIIWPTIWQETANPPSNLCFCRIRQKHSVSFSLITMDGVDLPHTRALTQTHATTQIRQCRHSTSHSAACALHGCRRAPTGDCEGEHNTMCFILVIYFTFKSAEAISCISRLFAGVFSRVKKIKEVFNCLHFVFLTWTKNDSFV